MIRKTLDQLAGLRDGLRRCTLLATAATMVAVVLLALAYRSGTEIYRIVIALTVVYLLVAIFRLVSSFQVDRQIDLETRFVQFAERQGRLLASAREAGKIWRFSCVVQGLQYGSDRLVPHAEIGNVFRRALSRHAKLLLPASSRFAIPALIAVATAWIASAWMSPEERGLWLFGVIFPLLIIQAVLEVFMVRARRRMREAVQQMIDQLVAEVHLEWESFRKSGNGRPYRHHLLYRDPFRVSS